MTDNTIKKIYESAQYIIKNNASIPEASAALGYSVRSIQQYINDDDKLKRLAPEVYYTVRSILVEKEREGRIKGGKNGKRGSSISEEMAIKIALDMISNNLTYEMASEKYGIPSSTIYENLKRIHDKNIATQLEKLAIENKGIVR